MLISELICVFSRPKATSRGRSGLACLHDDTVYGHCVCGAWVFVLGGGYLCQSFLQNMCMDSVCVC